MAANRSQGNKGAPVISAKSATSYPSDVRRFSGRSGGVNSRGVVLPLIPLGAARSAGLAELIKSVRGGIGGAVTSTLGHAADARLGVGSSAECIQCPEQFRTDPPHCP